MNRTIAESIASRIVARSNCLAQNASHPNPHALDWTRRHKEEADTLARDFLPSGSGFDDGTRIDWDKSNADRLVLLTSFHHMTDGGFYDGWTDHAVTVRASLSLGLLVSVSGKDRNGIKDYIAECFTVALRGALPEGR